MINIFLNDKIEFKKETQELILYYKFKSITLKSPLPLEISNENDFLPILFNITDEYNNKITKKDIDITFHPISRNSLSQNYSISCDNISQKRKNDLINPTKKKYIKI